MTSQPLSADLDPHAGLSCSFSQTRSHADVNQEGR